MDTAIDFARLARSRTVNYLHCAHGLDLLQELDDEPRTVTKTRLLNRFAGRARPGVHDLVTGYQPDRPTINLRSFRRDLQASGAWRRQFHALSVRGFSYQLDLGMRDYNKAFARSSRLARRVNLRIALMTGRDLFYPPSVRAYLQTVAFADNHYFCHRLPAIAFALGTRTRDGWFILAMQSDLTSRGPSFIREHFRGWRQVLFANVIAQAIGSTSAVYLCRSEDVERARVRHRCGSGPSALWGQIYDQTARDWGMIATRLAAPVDLQVLQTRRRVRTDQFYALPLEAAAARTMIDPAEVSCTVTL